MLYKFLLLFNFLFAGDFLYAENQPITIGTKRFTENYILGEIFAQLLEDRGYKVKRQFGLGGTLVAYNALRVGEIDVYPDYTGTIAEAILKVKEKSFSAINEKLLKDKVEALPALGFDNSYCIIMKKTLSEKLNIKSLSDLSQHPELVGGLSFEFQERPDGWRTLRNIYGLKNPIRGIDIPLTYEALKNNKVDFAEAYTTEPLIQKYDFLVLEDDKEFFPKYDAIPIVSQNLDKDARRVLISLKGSITNDTIMGLNLKAVQGVNIQNIANDFLVEHNFIQKNQSRAFSNGINWIKLLERTKTHMFLTGIAVLLATFVAVPLATLIYSRKTLSRAVLGITGILQTIPSIALLTFMIPFFGIGLTPAIIGLFIYSLLPILRNTHTAMTNIDPRLVTAARGIGLYPHEVLLSVKLPLAFPTILAGIRTATILNIGTATLAAFIGAGGLGEPIVTGLALNDTSLVLQGAIPAALLAIVVDGVFSLTDRIFTKNI